MSTQLSSDICIIGLGPAGLGAAFELSKSSTASKLICIDQGGTINTRSCGILEKTEWGKEEFCSVTSGLGGCSLLSGGKISNYPAGSGLQEVVGNTMSKKALQESIDVLNHYLHLKNARVGCAERKDEQTFFEQHGFEYRYFESYKFSRSSLIKAYEDIHNSIKSKGAKTLFNTTLENIKIDNSMFKLALDSHGEKIEIVANIVILALGRSGRRTAERLNKELNLGAKPGQLDVGVRLEFQSSYMIGNNHLHEDLKLLFQMSRTFCVCRGGRIAPYRINGALFTEGNYDSEVDTGLTNLAILTRMDPSQDNMSLLKEIETKAIKMRKGKLILQPLSEYLGGKKEDLRLLPSLPDSVFIRGSIDDCFPDYIGAQIRDSVLYFASRLIPKNWWPNTNVFAPEVDYPGVFFPIKPDFSVRPRLFMIGDCVGLFRGIAQAFASGIICAKGLIKND
jgi:hypothetical protein